MNDEYIIKSELGVLYKKYDKVKINSGVIRNKLHSYKYSIPLLNGDFGIPFKKDGNGDYKFKKYGVDTHYSDPALYIDMQVNHEKHIENFTPVRAVLDDIYDSFEEILSEYLKAKIIN